MNLNYVIGYIIIGLVCGIIGIYKKESVVSWVLFWPLMLFYTLLFKIGGSEEEPKERK